MTRGEHVVRFVVVVDLDDLGSVNPPPPLVVEGDTEWYAGVVGGWTQQST
jgi:hypothetical protein